MSGPATAPPRHGFRGYITARPIMDNRVPQHVQNLVIRDYAQRHDLTFKLSATEYAMPGCFMILEGVLQELPGLDGIIAYSLFMLPLRSDERRALYRRVLGTGGVLHFAVEGLALCEEGDGDRLEDIWRIKQTMDHHPSGLMVRDWYRNGVATPRV
jgi:sporadic carbohydrate cluster protein (TIGR04323 family)